jgi:chaperonin GroES
LKIAPFDRICWHSPDESAKTRSSANRRFSGTHPMHFRPLHDRVLVRRLDQEEKSKGGIIIPDTVQEKPQEGKVIAVGPGIRDEQGRIHALDVKADDTILFGKWSGTEIKLDGTDYLVMKESDIFGVVDSGNNR